MACEREIISVIVPVYNVEKYIHACIESILVQTYPYLEIILVDDGTPDNSGIICDEYKEKDKRIKVIHKKNGGLSSARNAGLDIATGKFIGFVDSDDTITPHMYEKLLSMMKKDVDIVCVGTNRMKGNIKIRTEHLAENECIMDKISALKEWLLDRKISCDVYSKLYRAELFNDIRFPEGRTFEDGAVQPLLFDKCNCIAHTGTAEYNYFIRPNSITTVGANEGMVAVYESQKDFERDLIKKYPMLRQELNAMEATYNLNLYRLAIMSKNKISIELYKRAKLEFDKVYVKGIMNKYLSVKKKLLIFETKTGLYRIRLKLGMTRISG